MGQPFLFIAYTRSSSFNKFSAEHVVSPTFYFLLKDKTLTSSSHDRSIEWYINKIKKQ